jgi:hypothetical protein
MRRPAIALALLLAAAPPGGAADDAPAGVPGLGEIMTLTQMRHLKLWFAGAQRNWDLAAYELDELQEGFDDAVKYFPNKDGVPVAQMVKDNTSKPMEDLKSAIAAKSSAKFAAAFDRLTAACNSCHQGSQHGFIAIRRPTGSPYSNQSFTPRAAR